ncbi:TPA: hypothetical protein ACH3X1_004332 [Trebouxia sp. C0004]
MKFMSSKGLCSHAQHFLAQKASSYLLNFSIAGPLQRVSGATATAPSLGLDPLLTSKNSTSLRRNFMDSAPLRYVLSWCCHDILVMSCSLTSLKLCFLHSAPLHYIAVMVPSAATMYHIAHCMCGVCMQAGFSRNSAAAFAAPTSTPGPNTAAVQTPGHMLQGLQLQDQVGTALAAAYLWKTCHSTQNLLLNDLTQPMHLFAGRR